MSRHEHGMVLVIALILLLPITLLALSMMQWSREDLKMVGASSTNMNTQQYTRGVLQQTLVTDTLSTKIAKLTSGASGTISVTAPDSQTVSVPLSLVAETTCRRKMNATSTNVVAACRYVTTSTSDTYAKGDMGALTMVMGIEQPLTSATTSE